MNNKDKVTNPKLFNSRRRFFKKGVYALSLIASLYYWPRLAFAKVGDKAVNKVANKIESLTTAIKRKLAGVNRSVEIDEKITKQDYFTQYNNFYELGTGKYDPVKNAKYLITDPWTIEVAGECQKVGKFSLEQLIKTISFEERVYRFRCVETWSAIVPWVGFPLFKLIQQLKPTKDAKFVAFSSIYDSRKPLPGQKRFRSTIKWPYREGLRIDEAMHPLTFVAMGIYKQPLPNQNGAPIRLVVPWKYGFKSIKSIVKIEFTKEMPKTSWTMLAPGEYGFYANVNPFVSHPRWSQATEKRLGDWIGGRKTLLFNGYADQVAHLYKNLDLTKNY